MSKRKKADSEFVPEVIEDGSNDEPYFFAVVPNQIEANDNYDPALIGFPLNILFGRIARDPLSGEESPVRVCYEPAPETFRENGRQKEMRYFTTPTNGFSVRVIFDKKTGRWQTEKYKGEQIIGSASGSTFDQAMIHTTMRGPELGER